LLTGAAVFVLLLIRCRLRIIGKHRQRDGGTSVRGSWCLAL
jgi:hypothetical protein